MNKKRKFRRVGPNLPHKFRVLARARWSMTHCFYCGVRFSARVSILALVNTSPTLDHVIALAQGGDDNPTNLVPCCWLCNGVKGAMPAKVWFNNLSANDNAGRDY